MKAFTFTKITNNTTSPMNYYSSSGNTETEERENNRVAATTVPSTTVSGGGGGPPNKHRQQRHWSRGDGKNRTTNINTVEYQPVNLQQPRREDKRKQRTTAAPVPTSEREITRREENDDRNWCERSREDAESVRAKWVRVFPLFSWSQIEGLTTKH